MVRLRLVHDVKVKRDSKVITESETITESPDPNNPGIPVSDEGMWQGTLDVPPMTQPDTYTVEASCDSTSTVPARSTSINAPGKKAQFNGGGDYTFPSVQVTDHMVILASTGFTAWPWTFLGAALLTVGAASFGAGRRRGAPSRPAVGLGPGA